jgi:hypothetical protein
MGMRAADSDAMKNRRRTASKTKRPSALKVGGRRKPSIANTDTKIALLERERDEALEQKTALSEVLRLISFPVRTRGHETLTQHKTSNYSSNLVTDSPEFCSTGIAPSQTHAKNAAHLMARNPRTVCWQTSPITCGQAGGRYL